MRFSRRIYVFNNLKRLRNEKELTQERVATALKCKRSTYNNWERGIVMIPIDIVDKISVYYKVTMSFVLGIENEINYIKDIKKMNYKKLLENLNNFKRKNKNTYSKISSYLDCNISTCQRYFKGVVKIPTDRLILLSKFYKINVDKLCGK